MDHKGSIQPPAKRMIKPIYVKKLAAVYNSSRDYFAKNTLLYALVFLGVVLYFLVTYFNITTSRHFKKLRTGIDPALTGAGGGGGVHCKLR